MGKIDHHYEIIRDLIQYLVTHKLEPRTLEDLATSSGMSSGHLQKVFTEWVGVTPKQFGRYLSLQYAKNLLAQNKTTNQTTIQSGLSSSGRLHDLFVDIEAMTPGEYQNFGECLTIQYSLFPTCFGLCLVASTSKGICNILFADTEKDALSDLYSRWPNARFLHESMPSHIDIRSYFDGMTPASKIKLHLYGTNFQLKVWEALLSLPEGRIATYGDIAERMGDKKLSRIVGGAIGNNPVGYLIPCHRVLKSTGEIGGYRWGVERKRVMLGYEATRLNDI